MSDLNAFERYHEAIKPRWERRRERATAKRKATLQAKGIERAKLEKHYKGQASAELEKLLEGVWGERFADLIRWLDDLTLEGGQAALDELAEGGQLTWLRHAPAQVRQEALILISRGIMRLRERHGLPPFDDGFPWQKPTVFVRIRDIIENMEAGHDEKRAGELREVDAASLAARPGSDGRRLGDRPVRA